MPDREDYVEKIAALAKSEKVTSRIAEGVATLEGDDDDDFDVTLFQDDALAHFEYDGEDDRKKQVDFLLEHRKLLEPRLVEYCELGHKLVGASPARIDKILTNLDGLLGAKTVAEIRKRLTDGKNKIVDPPSILTEIDRLFEEASTTSKAVTDAVTLHKFGGLRAKLDDFNAALNHLAKAVLDLDHGGLKAHLKEALLTPFRRFASGPAHRDAVAALANQLKSGFHDSWNATKKTAEDRFERFTELSGKKLKLSSAIKFDDGFGGALDDLEKAIKKGAGVDEARSKASSIGLRYLKAVEELPDKLKDARPDFYTPLHSGLLGILASLES